MKIKFLKKKDIELWEIIIDGEKSKYTVSRNLYSSNVYYIVNYGKRFCGRFDSLEEVQTYLVGKVLDKEADKLLGTK